MKRLRQRQKGFTIIELVIATSIFSVFLMIITLVVVQISRAYSKGIVSAKTQETARAVTSEIARAIQFGGSSLSLPPANPTPGTTYTLCAGTQRYTFVVGRQLKTPPTTSDHAAHVLVADTVALGCPTGSLTITDTKLQRELLGENMRLSNLSISQIGTTNLYNIRVKVSYGNFDDLENPNATTAQCKNIQANSQFCAVSELTTTVEKRL